MSIAKAITRGVRIPPSKVRFAVDLIRGRSVDDAMLQLRYSKLKGGRLLMKTLASAVANAENHKDKEVKREELYVSEAKVDKGINYKRAWSRSKGRSSPILRRTSHLMVAVDLLSNKKQGKN